MLIEESLSLQACSFICYTILFKAIVLTVEVRVVLCWLEIYMVRKYSWVENNADLTFYSNQVLYSCDQILLNLFLVIYHFARVKT